MSDETAGPDQQAMADEWAAAMEEQADSGGSQSVELDELSDDAAPVKDPKMDVILDIPVTLTMEVGGTDIAIRNLLQLNQGSVIELNRVAGEPLDVKVNGTLIAHGEVVVVNDRYGIRLTDVISPQERIKRLK
ncbi:MAG: flagellar motor switch protein FliN [Pontibacterium sp.]